MGRQAKMIIQAYHFPTLCFNFQFFLNPPVASQLPPLQREANPHKTTTHRPSSLLGVKRQSNPQTTIHPPSSLRDFAEVVAIHKPQKVNAKTKKKKKSSSFVPFVIAKAEGLWQSINQHYFIHSQKRKRNHCYLINQRINFK